MNRSIVSTCIVLMLATGHCLDARPSHRRGRTVQRRFVDVNRATVEELAAVPRLGRARALALVESRDRDGAFRRPVDLLRVPGIGARNGPRIARYLIFPDYDPLPDPADLAPATLPGPRPTAPIDLNLATPSELANLPGMGWALAYRIVAERDRNGPYRTLEDLLYVRGATGRHLLVWARYLYVEGRS
ncbi:MAG: helix-hairpin-helix domain-containing protein [Candidatus Riflebacteria bacterium]|nr:helix-hairpin-helix domain-containing protein [Candidatus Riflebacteria bacterium]